MDRKLLFIGASGYLWLLAACGSLAPAANPAPSVAASTPAAAASVIPASTQPVATPVAVLTAAAGAAGTTGTLPPIADAQSLVANLYQASDPAAQSDALLLIFKALNVGVYDARTGRAFVRGAERNSKDFYVYDVELKALAAALKRGPMRDVAYLADFFTRAGSKPNGKPVDPAALRAMLLDAVRASATAPRDPYSQVYLLVRELGLRHAAPYDMLHDVPPAQLQFDALQAFLIESDVLAPEMRQRATLNTGPMPAPARDGGANPVFHPLSLQGPCDGMVGIGSISPFGKYVLGLHPFMDVGLLIGDMIHGEALAYSVNVKAVSPAQSTHYGHESPGAESRFQIKVEMLDDYGDLVISCGALIGYQIPRQGGIPDVGVSWFIGNLDDFGTVTYEPANRKTNGDGIATLVFRPKSEKRPGQGMIREEKGTVTAIAMYQSAFGNVPGSVAQLLTPKSDVMAWTVARHVNLTLQIALEGTVSTDDMTVTYGPNKAVIPLQSQGGSLTGSYEGTFTDAVKTSECTGTGTFPVAFKVTATGIDPLQFSIQTSMAAAINVTCEGGGGSTNRPMVTGTRTITLPARDGASETRTMQLSGGQLSWTYTLKEE